MYPRLLIVGIVSLLAVLGLLGTAMPASDAPQYETYVVQANETFTTIATEYGITPELLAQFNKRNVNDPLKAGDIILVPINVELAPQETTYASTATTTTNATAGNGKKAPPLEEGQIAGTLAVVSVKKVAIYSKPTGGTLLFSPTKDTELLVVTQTPTHYGVLMSDGSIGWAPRLALILSDTQMVVNKPTQVQRQSTATGRQNIVDCAFEYLGIRYVYGGSLPNSVDCSLLVQTVFQRNGLRLPRTAADQFRVGEEVTVEDLVAGDRLYFHDRRSTRIGHTGIYIGNGRFIHASSNRGKVAVDLLSNPTYASIYAGARR